MRPTRSTPPRSRCSRVWRRRGPSAGTPPIRSLTTTSPSILWHAGRAPSGSNRQPFRFLVLRDGPNAVAAEALLGAAFREGWNAKRLGRRISAVTIRRLDAALRGQLRAGSRRRTGLPRAISGTVADEGASVYPACQNLLLAARALGYGGALTMWHHGVEAELRDLLEIPDRRRVVGVHHARCARRPARSAETQAARRGHVRRRMGPGPDLGLTSAAWLSSPGSTRPHSRPRSRSATSPRAASSDGDRRRTRR